MYASYPNIDTTVDKIIDKLNGKKISETSDINPDWQRIIFLCSNAINTWKDIHFMLKKCGQDFNRQRDILAKDDVFLTISSKNAIAKTTGKIIQDMIDEDTQIMWNGYELL